MNPMLWNPIVPYASFTAYTPALPQEYWDVYSAEQRIKYLFCEIDKIIAYVNNTGRQVNLNMEELEQLRADFEKFKESGFLDYYEKLILKWIDEHMGELFNSYVGKLWFGLTDDGRFCAYVPDAWKDIEFDTVVDYDSEDYGKLVLKTIEPAKVWG